MVGRTMNFKPIVYDKKLSAAMLGIIMWNGILGGDDGEPRERTNLGCNFFINGTGLDH